MRIKTLDLLAACVLAAGVVGIGVLASDWPNGLAIGVPLAAAAFALALLQLELYRRSSDSEREVMQIYAQIEALLYVHSAVRLTHPLSPMRGWAISPDFARLVISEVLRSRPSNVLECGSGISTIVVSACLKQAGGGKLWSLEQDPAEAQKSLAAATAQGLAQQVEVIVAPLRPVELAGETWMWYDASKIPSTPKLDLLIVDGPSHPPIRGLSTRYPCLPLLKDRLSDNVTIVVDDAGSDEARRSVARWCREFPEFELEWHHTEKEAAVLRRRTGQARAAA